MVPVPDISFFCPFLLLTCDMKQQWRFIFRNLKHWYSVFGAEGVSHSCLPMLHIHKLCEWWSWRPTLQHCCEWRVLSGAALFCLLTALLPVLGLADAEVSPRWLIVYCHLSPWPPVCHVATCYGDLGLWGGSGKLEEGAEEVREGEVCSSVVSRVCLNSGVAVSNMDHG